MTQPRIARPAEGEHAPYFDRYIAKVPDADLLTLLGTQHEETQRLLESISEEKSLYRYAPGKWSICEVVVHLSDCERIFAYRALRFARGDATPLPGFDENDFIRHSTFDRVPLEEHARTFAAVREASIGLFSALETEALMRSGVANNQPMTVRALAYIIAGHERHHVELIRERYLTT